MYEYQAKRAKDARDRIASHCGNNGEGEEGEKAVEVSHRCKYSASLAPFFSVVLVHPSA